MSEMSILIEEEEKKKLSFWDRTIARVTNLFGLVGGLGVALLMFHVVYDIGGRLFFNKPAVATLEISQYWYMPILVFFGLPLAERVHEHISAAIVYDRLSPRMKMEFTVIATVITVAILVAMAWFGYEEAMTLMHQKATGIASGVPIWPMRFVVPICSLLFAAEVVLRAIRTFTELRLLQTADLEEGASA